VGRGCRGNGVGLSGSGRTYPAVELTAVCPTPYTPITCPSIELVMLHDAAMMLHLLATPPLVNRYLPFDRAGDVA